MEDGLCVVLLPHLHGGQTLTGAYFGIMATAAPPLLLRLLEIRGRAFIVGLACLQRSTYVRDSE